VIDSRSGIAEAPADRAPPRGFRISESRIEVIGSLQSQKLGLTDLVSGRAVPLSSVPLLDVVLKLRTCWNEV